MPYLIDGHNLIGKLPGLELDDPHDEVKLIGQLKSHMARQGKRCIVVFDGGLPGGFSRNLSTPSVQVVFAHGGTTADAIIIQRIRNTRDAGSLIIVTADREIMDAAIHRRMRVISTTDFATNMNIPVQSTQPDTDNPRLTPQEVENWLQLFGGEPDEG